MNDLAPFPAARAERMVRTSFRAFRVVDVSGKGLWRNYEIELAAPADLPQALAAAQTWCFHKDRLAIRETDELSGETKLHLYAVKQKSAPTYVWKDHAQHRVSTLYVEPICTLAGEVL